MGTWSAAIFGNDTSCEVKEYFFEQYNSGKEPADLQQEILNLYGQSLDDREERYNVLLALAHCLWQTKALDEKMLAEIRKIIIDGLDLAVCKDLGAGKPFLRQREKALNKLLTDIESPKETMKKRVKQPVPVDSVYRNGCCLAFQYPNGEWGVAITVECEFFKRKATLHYAQTDIRQTNIPTMRDVQTAHLIDDWFDLHSEYSHHHKLHLYGTYLGAKEITRLNLYNKSFFTVIGYLPEWKDAYSSSSGGRQPFSQECYDDFKAIISFAFSHKFADGKRTNEIVKEINRLFSPV